MKFVPRFARRFTGIVAPGAFTVAWRAVAEDGHRTQGHYLFNVK